MRCASKCVLFLSFPVYVSLEIGQTMVLHAFIDMSSAWLAHDFM